MVVPGYNLVGLGLNLGPGGYTELLSYSVLASTQLTLNLG